MYYLAIKKISSVVADVLEFHTVQILSTRKSVYLKAPLLGIFCINITKSHFPNLDCCKCSL